MLKLIACLLGRNKVSYSREMVQGYYHELINLVGPIARDIAGQDYCLPENVRNAILEKAYLGPPSEETKKSAIDMVVQNAISYLSSLEKCWDKYLSKEHSDDAKLSEIIAVFDELDSSSRQILKRIIGDKEPLKSVARDLYIPIDNAKSMAESAKHKIRCDLATLPSWEIYSYFVKTIFCSE